MNPDPTSLERLHDIVVPAPVPWWPPAPGWYWVLGFILVVVVVLCLRTFIHWQQNRYRREALRELDVLTNRLKSNSQSADDLLALAELLKRTALAAFPRRQVASLTGVEWFQFLDRTGDGTRFSHGTGELLEATLHHPQMAASLEPRQLDEFISMIRHWIKRHQCVIPENETPASKNPSTHQTQPLSPMTS